MAQRNTILANLIEDLSARYPIDGDTMTYSEWITQNTKLNGRSFGYEGFEFQPAIINDMHPNMSVIKPSQVGMTEVQVRKFLAFLCRNRGTSGIFTFPDEKMFKKNSKTRIKPVVRQPVFNSTGMDDDKPTRAMNLYEINGSFAHIMGMTEGDATSTPADLLFHDEIDLSDQTMLGLYQSRLQNSDFRITQSFSTPTFPGFGIDLAYLSSDMREYQHKCGCCGHWQIPRFDMKFLRLPGYVGEGKLDLLDADAVDAIDLNASAFICERCSKALDLKNPNLREWVAERPTRENSRGYRIRPTSSHKLTPRYIIEQLLKMKKLSQLKGWYNTVLGETYNDGNSKLEPDMVKKIMGLAAVPEVGSDVPCALASDMGQTCHLIVGKILPSGAVSPFLFEAVHIDRIEERIELLRTKYNIVCGAVDRHPYTPTSNKIRDTSKRVILPVEYRGTEFVNLKKNEYDQLDFIQINRTAAIDVAVARIREQAIEMAGFGTMEQVVIDHLCDMVRIEQPEKMATWEKTTGSDHFMHSLTLLQASPKIAQVVKLDDKKDPPKVQLGMVGVPLAQSMIGGIPRNNQPTGPSSLWTPKPRSLERLI